MANLSRADGRAPAETRKIEIIPDFTKWAEGSVLISFGDTRVLCTATIDERVPSWLKEQKRGWITAEYAMLPRATDRRTARESIQGKVGGRTHEISRLIGRAIRAGADLSLLGERTLTLDCDVIQADGGTRTASVTGAWVSAYLALDRLQKRGVLSTNPLKKQIAAVSVGIVGKQVLLDLAYVEDQQAETDLNLVMNDQGGVIEIQGTAEKESFQRHELDQMLDIGKMGIERLFEVQRRAIGKETIPQR